MNVNRRKFLSGAALASAAVGTAACTVTPAELAEMTAQDPSLPEFTWQMATSFPPIADIIVDMSFAFAEHVAAMTSGKFRIEPRLAGELAPPLEVMNVVEQGAVQCGLTASYYFIGKSPVNAFGTSLPFGLTARQNNAWFYEGGGLALLREFYADRFGIIQFPGGTSGAQMGGWFNREIRSLDDIVGLKMRIPGLGGQVMDQLGATVQVLPGGEVFQALQSGAIDATDWIGPYDDLKMGFHQVARYYYYPAWWEPGAHAEFQVNLEAWNELPEEYQAAVELAALASNVVATARYDAKNAEALQELKTHDIEILPFPDDFMQAAETASFAIYEAIAARDPDFNAIFRNWNAFRMSIQEWFGLSEAAMTNYRSVL